MTSRRDFTKTISVGSIALRQIKKFEIFLTAGHW